jgi:hypothetical protein
MNVDGDCGEIVVGYPYIRSSLTVLPPEFDWPMSAVNVRLCYGLSGQEVLRRVMSVSGCLFSR